MVLSLKIVHDTFLKQQPVPSQKIENEEDKVWVKKGRELELHSWVDLKEEKSYLRVALTKDEFNGKNTWYVYEPHVEVWDDDKQLFPKKISIKVRNVTSCSTEVVRGLDKQIIDEMNRLIPNVLISFDDLDVQLGPAVWAMLQPAAKRALERAIQDRGVPMVVNSAYRTIAQQLILYNHYRNRRCGIPIAARPSRSNHQSGLAIDISDYLSWRPYLQKYGWRWLGWGDPVHFDYVGRGTRDIRALAVRAFQRVWNRYNINDRISEDGSYGPSTERRLNNSFSEGFSISVPSKKESEKSIQFRVLRLSQPYMKGEDVRAIQQALAKAGYSLDVDGVYGRGSEAVVKQFQEQNGLDVDGIVGPATRAKMGL
ncbi:MAG: peptidoglycan-binding protein [Moorea sp. SIOASIH]|uniref:peptidoglycan-binding protein n=1 Tax=Moorena sp. SIOASIH TaxID=2607817 RepID=UPI0013B700E1|nr:peptidoglycan-binding protein [Moorena sp. SIOASIH]NEO42155.1 peptidoglycan-binding protein [Moorena sp. SIOASIH]